MAFKRYIRVALCVPYILWKFEGNDIYIYGDMAGQSLHLVDKVRTETPLLVAPGGQSWNWDPLLVVPGRQS